MATRWYFRNVGISGGPTASAATSTTDNEHYHVPYCRSMALSKGTEAVSIVPDVTGQVAAHGDLVATFMSPALPADTLEAGDTFTVGCGIQGLAAEGIEGEWGLATFVYLYRPGTGWAATLSAASSTSRAVLSGGHDIGSDSIWRLISCTALAADIEVKEGDRVVCEIWIYFDHVGLLAENKQRYVWYDGTNDEYGDGSTAPDPASYCECSRTLERIESKARSSPFVIGYMGPDEPCYVVSPSGHNEVLYALQDMNDEEHRVLTDVWEQGNLESRQTDGQAAVAGDMLLTQTDVYQMAMLAGRRGDLPKIVRVSDLEPVDFVRPHIDQVTDHLKFTRFIRGAKLRTRGERTSVSGAPHTLPVTFYAKESIDIDGVVYVDHDDLSGGGFTCRNTPLLLGHGILRLSVVVKGKLRDITRDEGTYGNADRPSYTYSWSDGVVTLYGVTSGWYCCVYACDIPDPYPIREKRRNPAHTLPS